MTVAPTAPVAVGDWPAFGDTVRVTLYLDGSTLDGTHEAPHFERTGTVIATPRSGHECLVVDTGPIPGGRVVDEGGRWVIGEGHVTIMPEGRSQWTIEQAAHAVQGLMITALVNPHHANDDVIMLALRETLLSLGCELIPHTYGPDVDTVTDCASVPVSGVKVLDLAD
jgi:hypothetical protein